MKIVDNAQPKTCSYESIPAGSFFTTTQSPGRLWYKVMKGWTCLDSGGGRVHPHTDHCFSNKLQIIDIDTITYDVRQ